MIVKLLTEHHLEFLSLRGGCRGSSESKCQIVGNLISFHRLVNLGFRGSGFDISERSSSTAPKSATSIKPMRKYSLKKALSEPRKMTPEVTPLLTERYVYL